MDGKLSFGPIIRKEKQTMKNTIKNHLTTAVAALALGCLSSNVFAGTITIIGNGAGSGPIFVTDGLGNIDLGTRLRIGTFTDVSSLNAVISAFQAGTSDYNTDQRGSRKLECLQRIDSKRQLHFGNRHREKSLRMGSLQQSDRHRAKRGRDGNSGLENPHQRFEWGYHESIILVLLRSSVGELRELRNGKRLD